MKYKIAIVTPFKGKRFCAWDYFSCLKRILAHTEAEFSILFYDNSNNPGFSRMLESQAKKYGATYYKDETPSVEDGGAVYLRMHEIYTKSYFELIPQDVDYILTIEDDVNCLVPDAVERMLKHFEDEKVGSVLGSVFTRWLRGPYKMKPQVWKWTGKVYEALLPRDCGIQAVDATSQSFLLLRMSALKAVGLQVPQSNGLGVDRTLGKSLNAAGYKVLVDWSIKCRHFYKTQEDIIGFTSDGIYKRFKNMSQNKSEMTDRKSSPQFIKTNIQDTQKFGYQRGSK
jgi:hypothetical protein